jgi:hypothetical protein
MIAIQALHESHLHHGQANAVDYHRREQGARARPGLACTVNAMRVYKQTGIVVLFWLIGERKIIRGNAKRLMQSQ